MNTLDAIRNGIMLALLALMFLAPIGVADAQNPAHLTIALTGQTLTAGFNNTVTVTATNSYSSASVYPSGAIYDVDLAVSVPTPLQLVGDNHWHYDSIGLYQNVSISFEVYAPTSAIGSSYQGSVTLTYRQLGDISYTEETHDLGLSVFGWISLVLYGVQVTPSSATPGGNSTISGNLLNSGNIAAYNANVTVKSEILAQGSTASLFLGEVDPNIPRPFSLLVNFGKNVTEGRHSIVVEVSAIDNSRPASPYTAQQASQVQIRKTTVQPPTQPQAGRGGFIEMILEILRYLWSAFFGSSSPTLSTLPMLAYSYFSATTAFILAARQAG